ncbi:MAG: glycosyltransferase family 4 protein [Xanthobacteraceae bacterium]|nr:glycosyltransferase family 4 protein [Xanthobacteraceae bacterium]
MKIVLIIDRFDLRLGGSQIWLDGFARHLAGRGHDVHIVTLLDAGPRGPFTIHRIDDPGDILARARALTARASSLSADVVYDSGSAWSADVFHPHTGSALHSESTAIAASSLALRCRAALSPRAIRRRRSMRTLERAQLANARRIVAVSDLVARLLSRNYGVARSAITVVPNGIDTARFDRRVLAPMRRPRRTSLGLGDDVTFVMLANNLLLKGVDTAILALDRLRRRGRSGLRLLVAGGLPDSRIARLIRRAGVDDAVQFLGHVEDVTGLLAAADVLLHPTRWDACSLSTSEAMASGLPVVTTALNGASELITDGVDGFVLPECDDADRLATVMAALTDPGLRHLIGNRAYEGRQRLDVRINFHTIESLMLAGHRRDAG